MCTLTVCFSSVQVYESIAYNSLWDLNDLLPPLLLLLYISIHPYIYMYIHLSTGYPNLYMDPYAYHDCGCISFPV